MQLYSQGEQEVCIGKKYWKRTLESPIKVAKFYSLGDENSLRCSEQGNNVLSVV